MLSAADTNTSINTCKIWEPIQLTREQWATRLKSDRFLFQMPAQSNYLTNNGQYEISRYLIDEFRSTFGREYYRDPTYTVFTGAFDFSLIKEKGSLVKRIAKYMYKRWKVVLSDEQKTRIGNMVTRYSLPTDQVVFVIQSHIDWDAGDFNDDGSCYWGDRSAARNVIEDHGFAVKFFDKRIVDKATERGWDCLEDLSYRNTKHFIVGRAWLMPCNEGRNLVLFNAYGIDWHQAGAVIGETLKFHYYPVSPRNMDKTGQLLFINSGGMLFTTNAKTLSWLIDHDYLEKRRYELTVDFNIDMSDYAEDFCSACGDPLWEFNRFLVEPSGDPYCEACYQELNSCNECGATFDMLYTINVEGDFSTTADVCENCLDDRYMPCEICGDMYRHIPYYLRAPSVFICQSCREHRGSEDKS